MRCLKLKFVLSFYPARESIKTLNKNLSSRSAFYQIEVVHPPPPPVSWLMHRSVVYRLPLLTFECKPNWHISSIGIQIPNVVIGHSRDCLLLVFLNFHFLDQGGSLLYSSNRCVENQPKPSIRLLRLLRIQLIFYLFHSSQGWFWWHQIWPGSVFFLAFFQGGPVCCNWSGLTVQFWFCFRRNSARRWLLQNQCFPCL